MSQCIQCRGRGLCGRRVCPILRRLGAVISLPKVGESLSGYSPPDVFVGRGGYPVVGAGPLIPAEDNPLLQAPGSWMDLELGQIIAIRSSMVRSQTKVNVMDVVSPGEILKRAQEIAMSSLPVEAEVSFLRPPTGRVQFDGMLSPTGPSGTVRELDILSNPIIPRKVDQLVNDSDISAATAANELYLQGIDVAHISRLLSLGLLGRRRKLVPTRWSIVATDDTICKALKAQMLDMPLINDFMLYSGEHLGNNFQILLIPGVYSFLLLEIWLPRSVWSSGEEEIQGDAGRGGGAESITKASIGWDGEGPREKSEYSSLSGGYYAARLAVLEHLMHIRRQASVLIVREVSESYWVPLGVWIVRETVRMAMRNPPTRESSLNEAIAEIERRIRTDGRSWIPYIKQALLPAQRTLTSFH